MSARPTVLFGLRHPRQTLHTRKATKATPKLPNRYTQQQNRTIIPQHIRVCLEALPRSVILSLGGETHTLSFYMHLLLVLGLTLSEVLLVRHQSHFLSFVLRLRLNYHKVVPEGLTLHMSPRTPYSSSLTLSGGRNRPGFNRRH